MSDYLYIFGYETPLQRQNNAARGWDDEDSRCVLISAADANSALAWGNQIAQHFVAILHESDEVDWAADGFASWVEPATEAKDCPRVQVGQYPDFDIWLGKHLA